jgi:succinate-semialdehyde dehydrogenase/glutarate-semialdehyde dehydrogenase
MRPARDPRGQKRAIEMVDDAVRYGAKLVAGGQVPASRNRRVFFEPTVLSGVNDSVAIMREEPFGPIAPIATFSDFDEVIARANSTPYGLAGYVFSSSLSTATSAADAFVGMVGVNDMLVAAAEIPLTA